MKRLLVGATLACLVAVGVGACSDSSQGYDYTASGGGSDLCSSYTTCGSCTPVQGCGWCFNRNGGACASSADQCAASVSEFTWTWDPSGCPGVDASVNASPDAGTPAEASPVETGTVDSGTRETSAPPPDAPAEATAD